MKQLLLHCCCGPCATYCIEYLQLHHSFDYALTLFFSNSNILSKQEFDARLQSLKIVSAHFDVDMVIDRYDHEDWKRKIFFDDDITLENQTEGKLRCLRCFDYSFRKCTTYASKHGYDLFSTTLTISPYKDSSLIFEVAKKVASDGHSKVAFLDIDFSSDDGYKKSMLISKKLNLYRQKFCGCEFSQR